MNNAVEVDAKQVINMFAELDKKNQKKVYRDALRKASGILIKQTRTNLKGIIKSSITKKSKKTSKSLSSGVKTSIDREATQATVHIMGDFRLKFFEKGTSLRRTRKGFNRGQIQPKYFFRAAKTTTETEVFSSMEKIITESIIRVNNKYKG